jgi:hypothetical protein
MRNSLLSGSRKDPLHLPRRCGSFTLTRDDTDSDGRSNSMKIRIPLNAALGVLALLCFSSSAQAGLTICNRFDRAISVAFAIVGHEPGNTSQKSGNYWGWYGLATGECRRIRHIDGDNEFKEVTNGLVEVENGMVKNNWAMYLFARDDLGHVWDGKSSRVSSMRVGEVVSDRRDASGYVWPNTLNLCAPDGRVSPDVASVDSMNADTPCSRGLGRVPYFLINPRYAVEYQLEVK